MNGVSIIERFGGVRKLARALGVPATTVQHWKDVDRIPAQRQQSVLERGRELGVPITAEDFFASEANSGQAA